MHIQQNIKLNKFERRKKHENKFEFRNTKSICYKFKKRNYFSILQFSNFLTNQSIFTFLFSFYVLFYF